MNEIDWSRSIEIHSFIQDSKFGRMRGEINARRDARVLDSIRNFVPSRNDRSKCPLRAAFARIVSSILITQTLQRPE